MAKCTHRDRDGWSLVDFIKADGTHATAYESHLVHHMFCRKCGQLVPFGAANDTVCSLAVLVEIRAATIAASLADAEVPVLGECERHGWESHANNGVVAPILCTPAAFHAGWLAREIAEHRPAIRCDFRDAHDLATDRPTGNRCEHNATHVITWTDGRVSFGCADHLEIDPSASVKAVSIEPIEEVS